MTAFRGFDFVCLALISSLVGVGIIRFAVPNSGDSARAVVSKVAGRASGCTWARTIRVGYDSAALQRLFQEFYDKTTILERDGTLGILHVQSAGRAFWIKDAGDGLDGRELVPYLLGEHEWMYRNNPQESIRPGDTVVDCGAHVGVFTQRALDMGASKVIAIEPDATNLECFRRNHAAAIASGRVILVPQGAWSFSGKMKLYEAHSNSGMNSMVEQHGDKWTEVPVTTIDELVRQLKVKVDFIKMDIEGAEREALAGAKEILRRDRPRLMLDSYHRPDDSVVLPNVIRAADSTYRSVCGPCDSEDQGFVPHVTYWTAN